MTYDTASRPGDKLRLRATVPGVGSAAKSATIAGSSDTATDSPSSLIPSAGYSSTGTLAIAILAGLLVLLASRFWFASRQGSWVKARLEPHLGIVREAGKNRRRETGRRPARSSSTGSSARSRISSSSARCSR